MIGTDILLLLNGTDRNSHRPALQHMHDVHLHRNSPWIHSRQPLHGLQFIRPERLNNRPLAVASATPAIIIDSNIVFTHGLSSYAKRRSTGIRLHGATASPGAYQYTRDGCYHGVFRHGERSTGSQHHHLEPCAFSRYECWRKPHQ
jgi:hypothetical protein